MKQILTILKSYKFLGISLLVMLLLGCDNQTGSGGGNVTNSTNSAIKKMQARSGKDDGQRMDLNWTVDGNMQADSLNSALKDSAWHIITVTVVGTDQTTQRTAVNGLLAGIDPNGKISPKVDQNIELQDINCKSAVFEHNGDSCSVYMRLTYNAAKYTSGVITFPVLIVPSNPTIPGQMSFTAPVDPSQSVGNYRTVLPIEGRFGGNVVKSNPRLYQVRLMQNSSTNKPITITALTNPTNPTFTLMHRTTSDVNDPYYGGSWECNLGSNPGLLQTNVLIAQNDSCIVVYKVADTSTATQQTDNITVGTDAIYFFPYHAQQFSLIANYKQGNPVPDNTLYGYQMGIVKGSNAHAQGADMVMDSDGALNSNAITTVLPVNHINMGLTVTPQAIPTIARSQGWVNIPLGTPNIYQGMKILTDASPAEVSVQAVNDGIDDISTASSGRVTACGDKNAQATSTITVTTTLDLTRMGLIHLHTDNWANANCGGDARSNIDANVPMSNAGNITFFDVDKQGCGGGHWDIGGTVQLLPGGGCDSATCRYVVRVTSKHWGDNSQCRQINNLDVPLTFPRPIIHTTLAFYPSLNRAPTFIARGGQRIAAALGTQWADVSTQLAYDSTTNRFVMNGSYSNGQNSQSLSYQVNNLHAGDIYNQGIAKFVRSDGYDLTDFNINSN